MVRIDGPCFLDSWVHGDVRSEGVLVHVGDVVWLDLAFSDLVLAVGAEDGQRFFVILCEWRDDAFS